ncbi:hypothetical protein NDU88_001075 [Pleurodeles waltl]|uniref:Uncharacterized protein n=1 Tax=Pleurodeles waltl TaxID=8319 RepID=A0AAV7UTN9_PLEWA|nr:hypothetical protein NDU88_001075 [Pleurodeles waltl]
MASLLPESPEAQLVGPRTIHGGRSYRRRTEGRGGQSLSVHRGSVRTNPERSLVGDVFCSPQGASNYSGQDSYSACKGESEDSSVSCHRPHELPHRILSDTSPLQSKPSCVVMPCGVFLAPPLLAALCFPLVTLRERQMPPRRLPDTLLKLTLSCRQRVGVSTLCTVNRVLSGLCAAPSPLTAPLGPGRCDPTMRLLCRATRLSPSPSTRQVDPAAGDGREEHETHEAVSVRGSNAQSKAPADRADRHEAPTAPTRLGLLKPAPGPQVGGLLLAGSNNPERTLWERWPPPAQNSNVPILVPPPIRFWLLPSPQTIDIAQVGSPRA